MVDFNGFDKGVIGKKLPADTTLNCMRKSELIDLLHLAESNHRVLAEAYKIAVDTSKCNICPLHLDNRKVEDIKTEGIRKFAEWLCNGGKYRRIKHDNIGFEAYQNIYWKSIDEILAEYEKEQKGETE